jgi:predicted kinase
MAKIVIILRGCSGSGKSTYARRVKTKLTHIFGASVSVCSADDYFCKTGTYAYDRAKINKAHEECQDKARKAFNHGIDYILVDNTNVSRSDLKPYIELAKEFEYNVVEKVFGLDTDTSTLAARNQHGVPREKVELMARKLADSIRNVEGQTVKKANGILTVRIKR